MDGGVSNSSGAYLFVSLFMKITAFLDDPLRILLLNVQRFTFEDLHLLDILLLEELELLLCINDFHVTRGKYFNITFDLTCDGILL